MVMEAAVRRVGGRELAMVGGRAVEIELTALGQMFAIDVFGGKVWWVQRATRLRG
jgi:hypothetical protein